jgi:hypothetical protein
LREEPAQNRSSTVKEKSNDYNLMQQKHGRFGYQEYKGQQ